MTEPRSLFHMPRNSMKTAATVLIALSIANAARAETDLDEIIRKRDAVLSELVAFARENAKTGVASNIDLHEATIRLLTFRRDSAKTKGDRIKWQEEIVATEKGSHKAVQARIAIGVMTSVQALLAEERVLAAEQKLAEFQLAK